MSKYTKMISEFSTKMDYKMVENDHKTGWNNEPVDWLLTRLVEEVKELSMAVLYDVGVNEVEAEAADVANCAMMIADNYRHYKGVTKIV